MKSLAVLLLVPALVFAIAFSITPHQRVGDGMEYLAMYFAWKDTGRPFLTEAIAPAYDAFKQSGTITDMLPFKWLQDSYPGLRLGTTQDTNHFWFYSLIAAIIGKISQLRYSGAAINPSTAFAIEHAILAFAAAWVGRRLFGPAGLATTLFLLFCSPMLWFVDKIHTEFFTVMLSLIAVFGLIGNSFTWAALAFALASTQNPSFAIPAIATTAVWFFSDRSSKIERSDIVMIAFAGVITCLHPLYYFSRFGGLTPQVLGYGAEFKLSSLKNFYVWFIDPDIGLLPNWKTSILLIVAGILLRRYIRLPGSPAAYAVLALLFIVNIVAQSATIAINSGGTVDVARYALWYIPLFAPLTIAIFPILVRQIPGFQRPSDQT